MKLNAKMLFQLLKSTYMAWTADKAPRLGAALAYYTIFSVAPLLIVVIGVASLVFGDEAARGEVVRQLEDTLGRNAAAMIQEMLRHNNQGDGSSSWVATVIGAITVLLGAGALFGQLQDALNTVWGVEPKPNNGIWFTIRTRFLSFSMVLGIGFLLLVSLVMSALLSAFSEWLVVHVGPVAGLAQTLNFLLSFFIFGLLFTAMYKVLPDVEIGWRDVWVGGLFTSFLFTAGKLGLALYLGRPGVESAYGSAGALVIILLWVYYASQILFFGAEFTKVYAAASGSEIVPSAHAQKLGTPAEVTVPGGEAGAPSRQVAVAGVSSAPEHRGAVLDRPVAEAQPLTVRPQVDKARKDARDHALAVVAGGVMVLAWVWARARRESGPEEA